MICVLFNMFMFMAEALFVFVHLVCNGCV